jgi:hypothetical protein
VLPSPKVAGFLTTLTDPSSRRRGPFRGTRGTARPTLTNNRHSDRFASSSYEDALYGPFPEREGSWRVRRYPRFTVRSWRKDTTYAEQGVPSIRHGSNLKSANGDHSLNLPETSRARTRHRHSSRFGSGTKDLQRERV